MHGSQLPALSEVINIKFKPEDKHIHDKMIETVRYAQTLENIVKYKNKEIQKLQFMIKYLTLSQQKRDEMLTHIQEENRKLKEGAVQQEMQKLQNQIEQNKAMGINQSQMSMNASMMSYPTADSPRNSQMDYVFQSQYTTARSGTSRKPAIPLQNFRIKQKQKELKEKQDKFKFMQEDSKKQNKQQLKPKDYSVTEDKAWNLLQQKPYQDINKLYETKEHIQFLQEILKDEQKFINSLNDYTFSQGTSLFDNVLRIMTEHKNLYYLTFRIRKLLLSAIGMSRSMVLSEALEMIVNQTCDILESDRGSVFIFDQESETLWTKVAKGSQKTIRVPFDQGIVGLVFTTGKELNILNAYSDERFNKEVDRMTHFKTNTILCAPIFDIDNETVIGVLQCVNKSKGYFTKDDEGIIKLICQIASMTLRNAKQFDDTILVHNNLRQILKTGIQLFSILQEPKLIIESEKCLKEAFNVQKAKIYLVDDDQIQFYTYDQSQEKLCYPISMGIVGETYQLGEMQNVTNCYNHQYFNNAIDLDTTMPVIAMPLRKNRKSKIIGILEIVNSRGIAGMAVQKKPDINNLDLEALEFFGQQLCQAIENTAIFQNKQKYIK